MTLTPEQRVIRILYSFEEEDPFFEDETLAWVAETIVKELSKNSDFCECNPRDKCEYCKSEDKQARVDDPDIPY